VVFDLCWYRRSAILCTSLKTEKYFQLRRNEAFRPTRDPNVSALGPAIPGVALERFRQSIVRRERAFCRCKTADRDGARTDAVCIAAIADSLPAEHQQRSQTGIGGVCANGLTKPRDRVLSREGVLETWITRICGGLAHQPGKAGTA